MDFNNQQIDTGLLPKIEDLQYHSLENDYKTLLIVYLSIINLILVSVFVVLCFIESFDLAQTILGIIGTFLFIRIIWSYIAAIKRFQYKSYALREKDIVYRSGWLWRQTVTVPFNRVQHVQIDQGPLERRFDLARLKIFTAGGNSSDINIPGLRPDRAQKIKQFIVSKTAMDEEE